jgi:2-keto-4-pentenoate hydratase/2-oxohepta-3-ene-1,7-dioic acid hydratase in catechol pathway
MKIICIGRNYKDHAKELNNPVPKQPLVFMKPPSALLINNKPFYYPDFTEDLQYEAEIVLKICKNGRHIQSEFADSYYEQISIGIDFTARDIQNKCKEKGHPWEIAKGFDGSAPIGNFIPKPEGKEGIKFKLEKNEEIVQTGDTSNLIFNFNFLICYISKYFKLQLGDLIYTGTPAGVGPVKIGDKLVGYIGNNKLLSCQIK